MLVGRITTTAKNHIGAGAHWVILRDAGVTQGVVDKVQGEELVGIAVDCKVGRHAVGDGIETELGREIASPIASDERLMVGGKPEVRTAAPTIGWRFADRIDRVNDVCPVLLPVCCLGEDTRHTNQGDIFFIHHAAETSCFAWRSIRRTCSTLLEMTTSALRLGTRSSSRKARVPSGTAINSMPREAYSRRSSSLIMPASQGPQLMHTTRAAQRLARWPANLLRTSLAAL